MPVAPPAVATAGEAASSELAPGATAGAAGSAIVIEPSSAAQVPAAIETGAVAAPRRAAPTLTKFADWVLECIPIDARKQCALRQTVADAKGRRIIQIVVRHGGRVPFLEVSVPLGISIPYGVTINLSEQSKLSTQLVDCDAAGCRSVAPLDAATLGELKDATSVSVTFQDSRSGKLLTVGGSLNGFADGVKQVLAAM
jgi:invasion protein IalB